MSISKVQQGDVISSAAWNELVDALNQAKTDIVALANRKVESFVYGMIIMWNPKDENERAPQGWVLCDGSDDRAPNLSDRFIRAEGEEGRKGDWKSTTVAAWSYSLSEGMLPKHKHDVTVANGGAHEHYSDRLSGSYHGVNVVGGGTYLLPGGGFAKERTTNAGDHVHGVEEKSVGKSDPDNLPYPPYYALKFIMYVGSENNGNSGSEKSDETAQSNNKESTEPATN
ncbi:MAG: tail fiber protein [Okeania sp. SIO3B3]|nr:tail fiber protein [Okeania sp. SIO3B3]